jgi:hypothetical protein
LFNKLTGVKFEADTEVEADLELDFELTFDLEFRLFVAGFAFEPEVWA